MKTKRICSHIRFLIPALLVGLLVMDGVLGYVAPDPWASIEPATQKALAAEPPELELDEADEAVRVAPKGSPGKLARVNEGGEYNDGIYTGSANGFGGSIKVRVTIKDGKIANIEIISAPGETGSYLSKASSLTRLIVKKQSTNVDAVSGATYSSNGIIKAVRKALSKAAKKSKKKKEKSADKPDKPDDRKPEKPEKIKKGMWKDGTYTGEGEGFGGKLHVSVTIEDGRITGITLLDSKDGKDFMGKAHPVIFKEVLKKQGTDVDAVTGATFSSYGLIQAINDALTKASVDSGDSSGDNNDDHGGGTGTDPYEEDHSKTYIDGSYTASAMCIREDVFNYEVVVNLTVEDGKLSALSVSKGEDFTEDEEDREENDYYLNRASNGEGSVTGIIRRILESQSTDVDTVTGATFSSRTIKSAVSGILSDIAAESK